MALIGNYWWLWLLVFVTLIIVGVVTTAMATANGKIREVLAGVALLCLLLSQGAFWMLILSFVINVIDYIKS